jgi:hypothetical protein
VRCLRESPWHLKRPRRFMARSSNVPARQAPPLSTRAGPKCPQGWPLGRQPPPFAPAHVASPSSHPTPLPDKAHTPGAHARAHTHAHAHTKTCPHLVILVLVARALAQRAHVRSAGGAQPVVQAVVLGCPLLVGRHLGLAGLAKIFLLLVLLETPDYVVMC